MDASGWSDIFRIRELVGEGTASSPCSITGQCLALALQLSPTSWTIDIHGLRHVSSLRRIGRRQRESVEAGGYFVGDFDLPGFLDPPVFAKVSITLVRFAKAILECHSFRTDAALGGLDRGTKPLLAFAP